MADAKRAPRVPFALLVTALLLGGLGLLLALNTASAANELERHNLATKDEWVAAQVQQLRNEVALGNAPGSLQQAAAALGMVPAGNPAFIVLGADGTATVLGKPKAVTGVPVAVAPTTTKAKAKPTGKTTGKPTSKPTSTTTTRPSATPTGRATKTSGARATPTPSPTPTPTLTLPGGQR